MPTGRSSREGTEAPDGGARARAGVGADVKNLSPQEAQAQHHLYVADVMEQKAEAKAKLADALEQLLGALGDSKVIPQGFLAGCSQLVAALVEGLEVDHEDLLRGAEINREAARQLGSRIITPVARVSRRGPR